MKRAHFVAIGVAVLLVLTGILATRPKQARLTILIHGAPATNLTVTDFRVMQPIKLDETGTITREAMAGGGDLIIVPEEYAGGQIAVLRIPDQGHTIVDLQGRIRVNKTVELNLGFFRKELTREQVKPTEDEVKAIMSGETSPKDIINRIRRENIQSLDAKASQ